jgi:CheY-like chemotaxis protein
MKRKKGILVVEDDSSSRKLFTVALRQSGYDIAQAATGRDALDQVRTIRPALIIMDLELPGIKGHEVMERLKADSSTRDIPVIVTTALDPESLPVKRAIAAGAATILYKPTPMTMFEKEVRRYLSQDSNTTESIVTEAETFPRFKTPRS